MTVREYIEPMYKMAVSIQACNEYAQRDFPSETYNERRYYCHRKPTTDLKTEKEFEKILDYNVCCVTWKNNELVIQVG